MDTEQLMLCIRSIVREYKWPPHVIDELYVDDIDHHGLIFWYNDVLDMHEQLKKQNSK